ncbi:T9SS type B sorting domain-containing protein, partial [Flavobacterium sp. 270]|uniref:T9SS type B sorting domain-containing protein n=1 Tax=Flavobacterium sp. 270 TaxID=2512114 RepID=UPI0014170CA9
GTVPFTISGLSSGAHSVAVHDVNGCGNTVNLTILEPLTVTSDISLLPTCNDPNGNVTLSATGGTISTPSSYLYTKDNWLTSQVNPIFTGLGFGTYTFKVRDIVTGCEAQIIQVIEQAIPVTGITLTPEKVSCFGGSNGSISVTLNASNTDPVYKYSLVGGAITRIPQDSSIFNDLPAGNYTVTVTSGKGCSATASIAVDQPAVIVVNAPVVSPFTCTTGTNTTKNASITVNSVTGGSQNYIVYEFKDINGVVVQSGPSNVYNLTNLAGGTYSIRVLDDLGCEGSSTAPIIVPSFITMTDVTAAPVIPITCINSETMQVTVTTEGGTPALLNYTVTNVTGAAYNRSNTNGLFSDLGIGNYLVTVENPATGCTIKTYYDVFDPNTFVIVASPINGGEICYGTSDGAVDLTFVDNFPTPSNDAGPFAYTITGPVPSSGTTTGVGPIRVSGLTAGQYTVTAKLIGGPECTVTTNFTISQPLEILAINEVHTAITCLSGNNDGSITVSATGGWIGDYQYQLSGPINVTYSDQFSFENLTAGTYTVSVKDSKGCIATTTVILVVPDPIAFTASANVSVLSCYGAKDAVITVAAPTGGQGRDYTYYLNYINGSEVIVSGPFVSNIFTDLGAGTYTVTVKDAFSCETTSAAITITDPPIIEPSLTINTAITCLTNATLKLSVVGGTGPYTYSEDGTNYSASFASSVTFAVTAGSHRYFVKDSHGCVSFVSNDVVIAPIVPLSIDLDLSNAIVNCKGEGSALIIAEAKDGLGSYVYTLLNELRAEIRPAQNDGIFANLSAGKYIVHVKSFDCEIDSAVITVGEPQNALTSTYEAFPVKCYNEKNGKIIITASGGTGIIKYAISPNLDQFVESNVFDRLAAGTYKVIVQDILGCNNVYDIVITSPDLLIASVVPNSIIPEICDGDKDAAFSIQIVGGTAPYFESLDKDNGPFLPFTGNIKDYTGLKGGTHNVYIKDTNGCISAVEVKMPEAVILKPTNVVNYDCVNNMAANSVTIDPGYADHSEIDYKLDGTGTYTVNNIFTNVAPGNHFVTVRHTNGCEAKTEFVIKTVQPLTLVEVVADKGSIEDANIIEVVAGGGSPAYEYSFNGEAFTSSNKFKIYKTGIYEVIVRDQNGCTVTIQVPKTFIDICMPDHFTPNGDGQFDEWGPGCTLIYDNLTFDIFDRYGRVVAKYHYGEKWDGKYDGAELPTGDYWYVVKLNDPKDNRSFVGHFTLYR